MSGENIERGVEFGILHTDELKILMESMRSEASEILLSRGDQSRFFQLKREILKANQELEKRELDSDISFLNH